VIKKMILLWIIALTLFSFAAGGTAVACPVTNSDGKSLVRGNIYDLSLTTSPAPIKVGEPFALSLVICRKTGQAFSGSVKAEATMPMHKHGMNYQPSVESLGEGRFRLDGYLFHMPGLWRIRFDLRNAGLNERLKLDYQLD
jgi:hypothetical protein